MYTEDEENISQLEITTVSTSTAVTQLPGVNLVGKCIPKITRPHRGHKMSLHNIRTDLILMHTARWHRYTGLETVCTVTLITTEWTILVCSAVSNRLSLKFTACGWNAPLTTVLPDLTQRVLLWICLAITPQVKHYVAMPLLWQWLTNLSCSRDIPLWLCFN